VGGNLKTHAGYYSIGNFVFLCIELAWMHATNWFMHVKIYQG
jgi:hypothetical protein